MKNKVVNYIASMNLAITLLIMLAISSVIGTIVQQNQPYINYSIKFGPYWFEVFKTLGIYNVYSQLWFFFILAFLVCSVTLCLIRQSPRMIKLMRRTMQKELWSSLNSMKYSKVITHQQSPNNILNYLKENTKYKFYEPTYYEHENASDSYTQIRGRQGQYQKIGYLLTHLGVITICIGAFLDSNLLLKISQWRGNLQIETRNIPFTEIPDKSWVETNNPSFRGTINIPEGRSANITFVPWNEGYIVQKLPFHIELEDFNIIHYPTGQPKSFQSDLSIYNLDGSFKTSATISVNHPLKVDNITIYQSSFQDGGSLLDFHLLNTDTFSESTFTAEVLKNYPLTVAKDKVQFELEDFRIFNIQPLEHNPNKFRNQGPSFIYKLRNASGQAIQYQNYMLPVTKKGHRFAISGIRKVLSDEYSYLYIPLDETLGTNKFFRFLNWIKQPENINTIKTSSPELEQNKVISNKLLVSLIQSFLAKGFEPIDSIADFDTTDIKPTDIKKSLYKMLDIALFKIYLNFLRSENPNFSKATNDEVAFFENSTLAIASLSQYGYPFYLQLKSFDQVQSSGLQLTKSVGDTVTYTGFLLLVLGMFCMFYIPTSRLWLCVKENECLIAVDSIKNNQDLKVEINKIALKIKNIT